MTHSVNVFLKAILSAFCLSILMSCSESDKTEEELPLLVERLLFTFIQQGALHSFDPITGNSEVVTAIKNEALENERSEIQIASDVNLITPLDTDDVLISANNGDAQTTQLDHTTHPEFIAYVNQNELYLFDLETHYNHNLGQLPDNLYFCDIRPVKSLNKNTRENSIRLIKDDLAIFIKASSSPDCSENFVYHRAFIFQSLDEDDVFLRRSISLLEHTHTGTHAHDHEDNNHNHNHVQNNGEIDEDGFIFDDTNHQHNHTHTHDLQYLYDPNHDNINAKEIESVHNDPNNREFLFIEYPIYEAAFREAEEALMYSSLPINKNNETETFGYLGYDSTQNCIKFFEYDTTDTSSDDPLRINRWSVDLNSPTNFDKFSCGETIHDTDSSPLDYTRTNDNIVFKIDNTLYSLTLTSIFEDDDIQARAEQIRNKFTGGEQSLKANYSETTDRLVIVRDLSIYVADAISNGFNPIHLKTYSLDNTEFLDVHQPDNTLYVYKRSSSNQCLELGPEACFSVIQLNLANGQETTILTRKTNQHQLLSSSPDSLLYYHVADSSTASIFTYTINGPLLNEFTDSSRLTTLSGMWLKYYDLRDTVSDYQPRIATAISDTRGFGTNGEITLENPELYVGNPRVNLPETSRSYTLVNSIPSSVALPLYATTVNDYYGYVVVSETIDDRVNTKTYFYPSGKSFINPTGEFGDMKLMYQSIDQSIETSADENILGRIMEPLTID